MSENIRRKKELLIGRASPLTVRIEETNHIFVDDFAHEHRTSIAFVVDALLTKMRNGEVSVDELLEP